MKRFSLNESYGGKSKNYVRHHLLLSNHKNLIIDKKKHCKHMFINDITEIPSIISTNLYIEERKNC